MRNTHKLQFETLEDRRLLATIETFWTDAGGGEYLDGGNWSNGVANNGGGDTYIAQLAIVGEYSVNIAAPITVDRIGAGNLTIATLFLNGNAYTASEIEVGTIGSGTLAFREGDVNSNRVTIGEDNGTAGTLVLLDDGDADVTEWTNTGEVLIGIAGSGELLLNNNVRADIRDLVVGGPNGLGKTLVNPGGELQVNDQLIIGDGDSTEGFVDIDAADLRVAASTVVGNGSGIANLDIINGSLAELGDLFLGDAQGALAKIRVADPTTRVMLGDIVEIGSEGGLGEFFVEDEARVDAPDEVVIGAEDVDPSIGESLEGLLRIRSKGWFSADEVTVSEGEFADGKVIVESGGFLDVLDILRVGSGSGSAEVRLITLDGEAMSEISATMLEVGSKGGGTLQIDGGNLATDEATIHGAAQGLGFGEVILEENNGVDSSWEATGNINIGRDDVVGLPRVGSLKIEEGSVTAPTIIVNRGGSLSGKDKVEGKVSDNGGKIAAGGDGGIGTVAKLSIDGDFEMSTGLLLADIGGLAAGTTYDVIDVTGNATLGGTLDVDLIDGFENSIALGDSFSVVTATESLSGTFDTLNFDDAPLSAGVTWDVVYEATINSAEGNDSDAFEVILKVVKADVEATAFDNDANGDLVVDYKIHSDDTGYESDPFSIGIYQSSDGVNPTGSALQSVNVSSSSDLTPGVHSISISPSFYSAWESHYLMAVVDSGDVIDESNESNNDAVFRGAFLANGVLSIHGDDTANTIEITDDGANFLVDIDEQTIVRRSP